MDLWTYLAGLFLCCYLRTVLIFRGRAIAHAEVSKFKTQDLLFVLRRKKNKPMPTFWDWQLRRYCVTVIRLKLTQNLPVFWPEKGSTCSHLSYVGGQWRRVSQLLLQYPECDLQNVGSGPAWIWGFGKDVKIFTTDRSLICYGNQGLTGRLLQSLLHE